MPPKKDAKKGAAVPEAPKLDPEEEAERRLLAEQCKAMKDQQMFEAAQYARFHEEKVRRVSTQGIHRSRWAATPAPPPLAGKAQLPVDRRKEGLGGPQSGPARA